ncbi:MAG: hypothetical protein JXK05_12980 [Campylobacterales bacterium]|nr:hypothetical protein [Campylobacterales bacterium]
MNALYRLAIAYFCLFALALLASGGALALLKGGFTPSSVAAYYTPKSALGILEIAQPHLIAIGIFIMVLGHFFLFVKVSVRLHVKALYLFALLMILAPFAITSPNSPFALLKALATAAFVLLGAYLSLKLLRHALRG